MAEYKEGLIFNIVTVLNNVDVNLAIKAIHAITPVLDFDDLSDPKQQKIFSHFLRLKSRGCIDAFKDHFSKAAFVCFNFFHKHCEDEITELVENNLDCYQEIIDLLLLHCPNWKRMDLFNALHEREDSTDLVKRFIYKFGEHLDYDDIKEILEKSLDYLTLIESYLFDFEFKKDVGAFFEAILEARVKNLKTFFQKNLLKTFCLKL